MSVRKLKSGAWVADVTVGTKWDGTRDRRIRQFATRKEAEKCERHLLVERDNGLSTSGKITFEDFVKEVYWPQKSKLRQNTIRGYKRDIKLRLLPAFGSLDIDQINRLAIQRMLLGCSTRKVATNARETLSSILSVAMEMEMIPNNPAGYRYQFPEASKLPADHYGEWLTTFDEHWPLLEFLATHYPGEAKERIVVLALCEGMRKGEVFGLDWENVDLEAGKLKITQSYTVADGGAYLTPPKTPRARRSIPITGYALERMRAWGPETGPIIKDQFGKRMHPHAGSKHIRTLIKRCFDDGTPLPHITIYSCRHSFATACINAGLDVAKVSAVLGHRDVSTTQNFYVKPKLSDLIVDVSVVDDCISTIRSNGK